MKKKNVKNKWKKQKHYWIFIEIGAMKILNICLYYEIEYDEI